MSELIPDKMQVVLIDVYNSATQSISEGRKVLGASGGECWCFSLLHVAEIWLLEPKAC